MVSKFQSDATKDGEKYRGDCVDALERAGFRITHVGYRLPDCKIDVDIVAENKHGMKLLIECKGGFGRGQKAPGFRSSDNVKKALGSAYVISQSDSYAQSPYTPLIVMTPYIMGPHTFLFAWMQFTETRIIADVINDRDTGRLKYWFGLDWFGVMAHIENHPTLDVVLRRNVEWASIPNVTILDLWSKPNAK